MDERVVYRQCPLCESIAIAEHLVADCSDHPLYHKSLSPTITWSRCCDCGHVFTQGYYSEAACGLIYSNANAHQQVGYGIEQQRVISSRIVEKVLPLIDSGSWLDVGFGNASLLFTAQEYGFFPIGLDLRVDNVEKLTAMGIEAHVADISSLSLETPCAVISMADVLEHIPYPNTALVAAHRLLADNGVLFLSMPNTESMLWRVLDQQGSNPYWGEIEHFHNFSRSRLYELLHQFGFEPKRYGISERYRACMEVLAVKNITV